MIIDYDVSKASIFLPCKETIDAVGIAELQYTPHMSSLIMGYIKATAGWCKKR
jgi:hypothetical protein